MHFAASCDYGHMSYLVLHYYTSKMARSQEKKRDETVPGRWNQDSPIHGLRVLAKIIARHHMVAEWQGRAAGGGISGSTEDNVRTTQ